MKVGDLVTLSAYGKRLSYIRDRIRDRQRRAEMQDPLVGLVTRQEGPAENKPWETQAKYWIIWTDNCEYTPDGREYWTKYFHRKDLKMLSRA